MPRLHDVVVRPVLTEKSSARLAHGEYTFQVHTEASKPEIKRAIETLFGVHVTSVRTMIQASRAKSMGRSTGRVPRWKKAIVRLADGEHIEMYGEVT